MTRPHRHADVERRRDSDVDESNEGLLSGLTKPSQHSASSTTITNPKFPFPNIRLVLFLCTSTAGTLFAVFFFAPAIRQLFSLGSLNSDLTSNPRPPGPPGSETDKTNHWANVGASWAGEGEQERIRTEFWNGSHPWQRTVILVSLDGVRAEYLRRGLTPGLLSLSKKGIRAKEMKPQFPTLTFPNHWTLLTGLHPESHGIVGNNFWSPSMEREFHYTDPEKSWAGYWWGGEPIWATAARNRVKSAVLMWPGPPYLTKDVRPTYWRPYEDYFNWDRKTRLIENWLDMDVKERPQFIAAYLPEVDKEGHRVGPTDPMVDKSLQTVDLFCTSLLELIEARNLTDIVDIVIVSDHGMTSTTSNVLIFLDDLMGEYYSKIEHQDGWPSAGLWMDSSVDSNAVVQQLQSHVSPTSGFDVYTHDTMPERWHFSNNERIAPIYVVPRHGYAITNHQEFDVEMNGNYSPIGNHGYDNAEPDMQAIFVAHGPFAQKVKRRRRDELLRQRSSASTIEVEASSSSSSQFIRREEVDDESIIAPFENVEIYGLVAKLLNLKDVAKTNGTVGFWDKYLN